MKISLIIPMYNESAVIERTAKALSEYMKERFDEYEIIFSDDGSSDGSAALVSALGLERVRVITSNINRGKGYAVRNGMLCADGDIRIFTDADLAYGTDVIGKAVDTIIENADCDMLLGSRGLSSDGYSGYTFFRRCMSRAYIVFLRAVAGTRVSDSQCGFKCFRSDCANELFTLCSCDGFAFDLEVILLGKKLQKRMREMPVSIINHGDSSVKPVRDALRMLRQIIRIKKGIKNKKMETL